MRYRMILAGFLMVVMSPVWAQDQKPLEPEQEARIRQLIKQLGAETLEKREWATRTLVQEGTPALVLLRKAMKSIDPEVAMRSAWVEKAIAIQEKIKFSRDLLAVIPDLVIDLAMADGSSSEQFQLMAVMLEPDGEGHPKHQGKISEETLAAFIALILRSDLVSDRGRRLLRQEKLAMIVVAEGGEFILKYNNFDRIKEYSFIGHDHGGTSGSSGEGEVVSEFHGGWPQPVMAAAPSLNILLGDGDYTVRSRAAISLGVLKAEEMIPDLVMLMQDEQVRASAVQALKEFDPVKTQKVIVRFLNHHDLPVRLCALRALAELVVRSASLDIVTLLEDPEIQVRLAALQSLQKLAGPQEVPDIVKCLGDHDASVRVQTLHTLSALKAVQSVSDIRGMLKDQEASVRATAIHVLGGLAGKGSILDALPCLEDADASVRRVAMEVLISLDAREAVPKFQKMLKDGDAAVRVRAVQIMNQFQVRESIPDLRELLNDSSADVRTVVVETLGLLKAAEALSQIKEKLKDENTLVRYRALEALDQIDAREALPELRELLHDQNPSFRARALDVIGRWTDKKSVPQIRDLLSDGSDEVRLKAVEALDRLDAREAIPDIKDLVLDYDSGVRRAVLTVLARWKVAEAAKDIEVILKDEQEDPSMRGLAAIALVELGKKESLPKEAPELVAVILRYGTESERVRASESLRQIGFTEDEVQKIREGTQPMRQLAPAH